jgi:aminopeptidase N
MKPFIEQPGVPVVKIDEKCQGNTTDIALRQERFFGMPGAASASSSPLWAIPVCFKTPGNAAQQCVLLEPRDQKASLTSSLPTRSRTPTDAATIFRNTRPTKYAHSHERREARSHPLND